MKIMPAFIQNYVFCNVLGGQKNEIWQNLQSQRILLTEEEYLLKNKKTFVGKIELELPTIPEELAIYQCRNNQVVLWCLQQLQADIDTAIAKFGKERIAVVMGTSTAGIDHGEEALIYYQQKQERLTSYDYRCQELGSISGFVSKYLGINGVHFTISTACSSSARVFISAQRLLQSGLADAVLVGGVDTLCHLTLNGFSSLASLSTELSTPFAATRDGINIGEAGAMFLLTREKSELALVGFGESSDAHHISAPEPNGKGAEQAMKMALETAGILAQDIGYLNLHGTATPLNDSMESLAVSRLFKKVPCSSTKHLTGHTLGAAGATEAAIACLILEKSIEENNLNFLPQQSTEIDYQDPNIPDIGLILEQQSLKSPYVMSNSFAFGGNNASLIFHKWGQNSVGKG